MYVAPNKNLPGLKARTKAVKEAAAQRAQVEAEVKATQHRANLRKIAGK